MNVLLINPERSSNNYLPLGLISLAAYVEKYGYETELFSLYGVDLKKYKAKLTERRWDVIGFTGMVSHYATLKVFCAIARKLAANACIIIGGPLANALPRFIAENLEVTMVVMGEGEIPFLRILRAIERGDDGFSSLPGVSRVSKASYVYASGEIPDIDDIPMMASKGIDVKSEVRHSLGSTVNIQLSRGCPNKCSYCDNTIFPRKMRRKSKDCIERGLMQIKRIAGIEAIYLDDMNPFMAKGLINDFLAVIKEIGLSIDWYANAYAELMHPGVIEGLKEGHCAGLHFGIESGSKPVLKEYNKHIDLDHARSVIKECVRFGIDPKLHWIIGAPGETRETIEESIDYFSSVRVVPSYKFLAPLPGTEMFRIAMEKGKIRGMDAYLSSYTDWYSGAPMINLTEMPDGELAARANDAIERIQRNVVAVCPATR